MTNSKYDSEVCGSLPLHLINLIQPYGALLVLDPHNYAIVQVSENAEAIFRIPVAELVMTSLDQYISAQELDLVRDRIKPGALEKIPAIWEIKGARYLVIVHPRENMLIVEIDMEEYRDEDQNSFVKVYQEIKYAMGLIQSAPTVRETAEITARELKRISGFDKVMVYRFDEHWNGTVIAEEHEEGMEAYNGFTFPASDIPPPARQMYLKNPYRFIPNREYKAVKLFPVINSITSSFVDLSSCNVRAVAGVHLEYLKNMNVTASMSTRILVGDQLWGLIACHHLTEKKLSFELRSIFEMISNIVSAKITGLQSSEAHLFDSKLKEDYKDIMETAYRTGSLDEALINGTPDILALLQAQGVVITRKGKVSTRGLVPDAESLRELILWLHTRQLTGVYHTDSLSEEYDLATAFRETASGLIAIPINSREDEYLLVFRPEVIRVINWGGNPEERIQFDADRRNYHPRNSFRQWREQVQGTSLPWRKEELTVAENLRSFIFEFHKN